MSHAVTQGLVYAGAMVTISFVTGSGLQLTRYLMDGASMGVASIANDMTHTILQMPPSRVSSAAANGGYFALFQSFRGDDRLVRNVLAGAVNDGVANAF